MRLGERRAALQRLATTNQDGASTLDVLVIGGGITGAGILREASRRGLRAGLVEQGDFASGTSSRSSKMVHGGLRYLGQGAFGMTRKALKERERLLVEAPGLVERMPVAFTLRRKKFPGRYAFALLLGVYDRLAGINDHRFLSPPELRERAPGISTDALKGAYFYTDALTDDARLVLRVIGEAVADGAVALNYAGVVDLLEREGRVSGVTLRDEVDGREHQVDATVVVNATGAWADSLRSKVVDEQRMRPLRGSHLIVPAQSLPVADAVTFFHPEDGRPVYAYPWLGVTVIGTTDLDHSESLATEPSITTEEVDYLFAAVVHQFPDAAVGRDDVLTSMSGVRPVIGSAKSKDPSKETREEAIWSDRGMVTVSGGKLTTFRPMALDVLRAVERAGESATGIQLDDRPVFEHNAAAVAEGRVPSELGQRMAGSYGADLEKLLDIAEPGELDVIAGTPFCSAELRYALRNELVVHLDDLLLRRTRIGNLLKAGGVDQIAAIESLCMSELGWDRSRWEEEKARYRRIVAEHYTPPT